MRRRRRRCCRCPRTRWIRIAGSRHTCRSRRRARRRCPALGGRRGACRRRVGGGAAAEDWSRREQLSQCDDRPAGPDVDIEPQRLAEQLVGRRLHAAGSGRRARRVLRARRHRRRLPAGRRRANPHRVHRRHRRVDAPVRSRRRSDRPDRSTRRTSCRSVSASVSPTRPPIRTCSSRARLRLLRAPAAVTYVVVDRDETRAAAEKFSEQIARARSPHSGARGHARDAAGALASLHRARTP